MEEWISIKDQPLPKGGLAIVTVNSKAPNIGTFSTTVMCSGVGPLDSYGDVFEYVHEITHWMRLPPPFTLN